MFTYIINCATIWLKIGDTLGQFFLNRKTMHSVTIQKNYICCTQAYKKKLTLESSIGHLDINILYVQYYNIISYLVIWLVLPTITCLNIFDGQLFWTCTTRIEIITMQIKRGCQKIFII